MSGTAIYTTDRKEEVRTLGKDGEVQTLIRIWATTKKGTYFHIDVPEDELDKAPELLNARAMKLDAI